MRRVAVGVSFGLLLSLGPLAAEEKSRHQAEAGADTTIYWKLGNFVLLAAALGYLIRKHGGPYFAARSSQVRRSLEEAARMRQEAEARYQEVEQRLARLGADIDELRGKASEESGAETERARRQTAQELEKIRANAGRELAAATRAARQELRAYSAELAVALAAQKIRHRMTPEIDAALVEAMVGNLERRQSVRAS